jgi:phage/plasmid-associated DNA primase
MAMLLKYYIEYKATGKIVEPKEVTEYTNEYQKKNDIFADFCEGYIKDDESSSVPLQKVFAKFNEYCTMDNIKTKGINKNVFKEAMVKRYGPLQKLKNVAIWKGIALIENNNDLSDSDDDI